MYQCIDFNDVGLEHLGSENITHRVAALSTGSLFGFSLKMMV